MQFSLTAVTVAIMFLYAVPGFLLVKCKAIKSDAINPFTKVLMFVCQPCLSIYSFQKVGYSLPMLKNMGIVFGLSIGFMLLVVSLLFVIFRKKYADDASYRVLTVATVMGNVGFLGVPMLESLLPNSPEAICFSAVFIVSMNLLAWTIGCFVLTGDKKYFSIKKIILNPPMLTLFVALPLFFTNTAIPEALFTPITILAKMTTPMCMLIVGMRFACSDLKKMFSNPKLYLSVFLKLVAFPLVAFGIMYALPIAQSIKTTLYILCCMPTASLVLNLGELFNVGQEHAAGTVLVSTLFSMLTVPLLLLIC